MKNNLSTTVKLNDYFCCNNDTLVVTTENTADVQTLKRCIPDKFAREMGKVVERVEEKIQIAILAARDNIITPAVELSVRTMNASSSLDATRVTAYLGRGERIGINAPFENVSDRDKNFHDLNVSDETRGKVPDEVSVFPVPGTHLDWQTHTHDSKILQEMQVV